MTTGIVTGQVAVHCDVCTSETGAEPRVRIQAQRGGRTMLIACWPCLVRMHATLDALVRQGAEGQATTEGTRLASTKGS